MKRVFEYTADEKYDGVSVKDFIRDYYNMSTSLIKMLKSEYDGIRVNGVHQSVTYKMRTGDVLELTMYDKASEKIMPVDIPIDIIYEDEDIAVVNKQPHLPVHPAMGNHEHTLANAMMYHWQTIGEEHIFRAVNRLDKDTSGIMLIAKNTYSHAQLCEQLREGRFKRQYRALVCGNIESGGRIDAPIGRAADSIIKRCVTQDGQRAVTNYIPIKHYNGYTLAEFKLETGRTHQIRVHMAYIGHPLLGDGLYGEENQSLIGRCALHSVRAEFYHPVTHEYMEFVAEEPSDMAETEKKLGV